ncbi:sigma-54-dependent Fis family transcriptional regulator [Methylocystis sp. ATCC 49242]|uniref:sigma-54 interaction domain-containing protein n=1 Tax=Methylocystis sp. ATCC 49242 TaxID=622637 RepID=UPI0001F88820|nr:sigma-54 dependent transcriptional regulator [Methylocystis sp. ATCC 49242]
MLVSWLGTADLKAPEAVDRADIGPVASTLAARTFDRVLLLADQNPKSVRRYESWLRTNLASKKGLALSVARVDITNPTNFEQIYSAVTQCLDHELRALEERPALSFNLSSGTPAMAATWVVLGKTKYRAELLQSSRQTGVETASVPFDISLSPEFVTDVLRGPDRQLEKLSGGASDAGSKFGDIIYRGPAMRRLIERASKAAPRSVPVLIEGESGTGKELLARAIHAASPRRRKPLEVVNCGAIPPELAESALFGHVKGAFTGAVRDQVGHFEAAHGGALFLDEVGELPLLAQVKLLRAIQEGEIRRVGDDRTLQVDVRIIAATNRQLAAEVAAGRFREDLFYRLAVLILRAPPLREREGDLEPLIDGRLARINAQSAKEPGFSPRRISPEAKAMLMRHGWPGNVRELENTLRRAAVWCDGEIMEAADIADALLPRATPAADAVLGRPLEAGVDLPELLAEVARHYLSRAMSACNGNKSRAAELVGLASYQTLTNWLEKYDVTEPRSREA